MNPTLTIEKMKRVIGRCRILSRVRVMSRPARSPMFQIRNARGMKADDFRTRGALSSGTMDTTFDVRGGKNMVTAKHRNKALESQCVFFQSVQLETILLFARSASSTLVTELIISISLIRLCFRTKGMKAIAVKPLMKLAVKKYENADVVFS